MSSASSVLWLVFVFASVMDGAPLNFIVNKDVMILVHGFFGWGPEEMLGFNYWGGVNNIANELKGAGHDVRVGVVGPVSSNWDRACELYAYIKGGTVDYGETHAAKFHHNRFGRTFPGLYPEWGTVDEKGALRRIHLIGHSQGGQTIRTLLRLLADGDANERKSSNANPLFDGGRVSWVNSITTVNTPHDGTTVDGKAMGSSFLEGVAWPLFKGICGIAGVFGDTLPYDFKLDQFGLERWKDEGFFAYFDRIGNASIWDESFRDFSSYDLSVPGAREMNEVTPTYPSVYYFSYATMDTQETINPFSHVQVPQTFMWLFLWPLSYAMGRTGDESWWPNDGVVNTISQNGPKAGSKDVIVNWVDGSTVLPGVWNYMGARNGIDHIENVGMGVQPVEQYYKDMAAKLQALPAHQGDTATHGVTLQVLV